MTTSSRIDTSARLLPSLLIFGCFALALMTGLLSPMQRWVEDELIRASALRAPERPYALPDVSVVALDADAAGGPSSGPSSLVRWAEVIRHLDAAGARVIAFDIDLSRAAGRPGEAELASAMTRSGKVVLVARRERKALSGGTNLEVYEAPSALLVESARAVGSVAIDADVDGVLRRIRRVARVEGSERENLAAVALAVVDPARSAKLHAARVDTPRSMAPLRLDFRRATRRFPVIPIDELLHGRFDPSNLAGRVVFVGRAGEGNDDSWRTPLDLEWPRVFVDALAYRTLVAESTQATVLETPGSIAQLGMLALLSVVAVWSQGLRFRHRILVQVVTALAVIAGSVWLVIAQGLLLPAGAGLGILASHFVLGFGRVRKRLGIASEPDDTSWSELARVGGMSGGMSAGGSDALMLALSLLGDLVHASGASILCPGESGKLDGRRVDWRPEHRDGSRYDALVGVVPLAADVMAVGEVRVFMDGIPTCDPGRVEPGVAVYLPLHVDGESSGVLVVECRRQRLLTDAQLRTVATLGAQLALSVHNLRLLNETRSTFSTAMSALASAVEGRGGYTELHCQRIAAFSTLMAERLQLSPVAVTAIELGALLHDIGKIGISDSILNKPDLLTPEERREMERHPRVGAQIAGSIRGLPSEALDCIVHHHERWDGSGYPDGLRGQQIPLGARIVSIVDVWDVLSSARPYKEAMSDAQARVQLMKSRGVEFDPDLLDLFITILEEEGEEMIAVVEADSRVLPLHQTMQGPLFRKSQREDSGEDEQ